MDKKPASTPTILTLERQIELFRDEVTPHLIAVSEECVKIRNILLALKSKHDDSDDEAIQSACTDASTALIGELASACILPTLNIIMAIKDLGSAEEVVGLLETALDSNIGNLLARELDLHSTVIIDWHPASECEHDDGDGDGDPSEPSNELPPSKLH